MKNLFKSALWACAALLVYSCTNDLDESGSVNAPDEGFPLTIEASHGDVTDETRTHIELSNGNHRILWDENDWLSIVEVVDDKIIEGQTNTRAWQKENRDGGRFAVFETVLNKRVSGTKYDYLACYPYSASNRFETGENVAKVYMNMPAEQKAPGAGACVEASTMLLTAEHRNCEGRPYQIDLAFNHAVAYVKLNFKGLELAKGEKIARIIFTAGLDDENDGETSAAANDNDVYLAGSCVYDYNTHTASGDINGTPSRSVTLDIESLGYGAGDTQGSAENLFVVDDFSVYLATLPVPETANFNKFSITVVTAVNNKNYTKKSNESTPALTLNAGMIRNINVSGKGFEAEKITVYRKATSVEELIGKECVITSVDGATYTMANNEPNKNLQTVNIYDAGFGENLYQFDEATGFEEVLLHKDASHYTWSIRQNGDDGTYTIYSTQSDDMRLKAGSDNDRLTITDKDEDNDEWNISYDNANNKFNIQSIAGNANIQTNRGQYWFISSMVWSTVQVYYKTDSKMDSNSVVPEREEKNGAQKYYKKVTAPENGKNYVIAAAIQTDGKTVYYTFNNYFNLKKEAERTPKLLLASDAANGENNAGFVPANIEGFNEGDVYTSTRGGYYTWSVNGTILTSTDSETNGKLANTNNIVTLEGNGKGLNFSADGDGVNIKNETNGVRYMTLRVNNDKSLTWGYDTTPTKLYLFEESDTAPEPPVEDTGTIYKKVTAITAGKQYILVEKSRNVTMRNVESSTTNVTAVQFANSGFTQVDSETISGDDTDYYFTAVANSGSIQLMSPKTSGILKYNCYLSKSGTSTNNLYCKTSPGTLGNFTITYSAGNNNAFYITSSSGNYLYTNGTNYTFSSSYSWFYFYEKQE